MQARHVLTLSSMVSLSLLVACGDGAPGDLPDCDLTEADVELSLDDDGALVATWPGDLEASYLGVSDPADVDGDDLSDPVFAAGELCGTYWFVASDATCTEGSQPKIGGAPLATAALDESVPTTGDPVLARDRPYEILLVLSDFAGGDAPTCRTYIEVEKTF